MTSYPHLLFFAFTLIGMAITVPVATAGNIQDSQISGYGALAKSEDNAFTGFSKERGQAFFLANPASGKPNTPSCTSCHSKSAHQTGRTRAGKEIAPMALSKTPSRYNDPAKVEKWFLRNCTSVLGRTCTSREKGDFLTFMTSE